MRSRNVKPGFFTNEVLGSLAPLARLLYVGLWCIADKEGRLEDRPTRIKAEILPYDDCDADALLAELAAKEFILRYECFEIRCIAILKFKRHQHPHPNEKPSILPAPGDIRKLHEDSITTHVMECTTRADSLLLIPDSLSSDSLFSEETLLSEPDGSDQPLPSMNGKGKRESIAAAATGIWKHWLIVWPDRGGLTFTNDRRRAVEARLREGIKPAVVRAAVERSKTDTWWNGEKDGEWKADIKTICGKGSTVENLAFDTRSALRDPHEQRIGRLRELRVQYGDESVRAMCETEELWQEVLC